MKLNLRFVLFLCFMLMGGCRNQLVTSNSAETEARPDGAEQIPISMSGSLQNAAFSPDSNELLMTHFINGYNVEPADLLILNMTTGISRTLVTDGSGNISLPGSVWNPVTDAITFASTRDPHDEIYIIDADGAAGSETKITDREGFVAYEPSFSPDGEWVVFESHVLDVEGNGVVTKYKVDGSQPYEPLTAAAGDNRQPNWSPSGNRILYQTLSGGQWDIWVMDPDGANKLKVTSGGGDKTDASFSPDGNWIVYSSDEGSLAFANLFIISVNGGASTRVTTFNGYDGAPSWSGDNQWIAFESSPQDPDVAGTTLWKTPVPAQFITPTSVLLVSQGVYGDGGMFPLPQIVFLLIAIVSIGMMGTRRWHYNR